MKVRELINQLILLADPEADVIISRDPEGNGFNPLAEVVESLLDRDGAPKHPDDICDHKTEDECEDESSRCEYNRRVDLRKAVVLWP